MAVFHVFVLVVTAFVAHPDGTVGVQASSVPFSDAAHCEAARTVLGDSVPSVVGAYLSACHDEAVDVDPSKIAAAKDAAKIVEPVKRDPSI